MNEVFSKISEFGFSTSEDKTLRVYLDNVYNSNRELFEKFTNALIKKDWRECRELINSAPDDVKDIIEKRSDVLTTLFNKIGELFSILGETAKTAFKHARELAESDPEKAKYIFGLALVGIIVAYLFGKKR